MSDRWGDTRFAESSSFLAMSNQEYAKIHTSRATGVHSLVLVRSSYKRKKKKKKKTLWQTLWELTVSDGRGTRPATAAGTGLSLFDLADFYPAIESGRLLEVAVHAGNDGGWEWMKKPRYVCSLLHVPRTSVPSGWNSLSARWPRAIVFSSRNSCITHSVS